MDSAEKPPYKRAARLLTGTFLVYALLVAAHLGEFWPFSIYPMFSRGGQTWSRAVVRDVTAAGPADSWTAVAALDLPGASFAVVEHGVDHIDLANFVSKTKVWDTDRVDGLRSVFGSSLEGRRLLVYRVTGTLTGDHDVEVQYHPYLLMEEDTTLLNPDLPRQ